MLARGAVADDPLGGADAGVSADADVTAPAPSNNDNPAASATGLEISLDRTTAFVIKLSSFIRAMDRLSSLVR
jgi:hypothetical protein